MKRIAIFGGTFDPIHIGHCMVASSVVRSGAADEVWLMVSPRNPFKNDKMLTDEKIRLEMVNLACEGAVGIKGCDFEFSLPRPSYTAATLRALKEHWPENEYRLLIGADNWLLFDRWREPETIVGNFGVIVYPRGGVTIPEGFNPLPDAGVGMPDKVTVLTDVPEADISSTYIRSTAARGESVRFLVPDNVARFIAENKIYSSEGNL